MASSVDWARTIGTTLVLHLKEEELATFRKYKIFALLEGSGRVAMNQGGRGFDWEIRYRNQPVASNTGESPRVFARHNLWQRLNLPYRGYSVTDMVTKREMLENRGVSQLIDVAGKMASRLQESMQEQLGQEIYIDGNLPGNENRWHGLESIFGTNGSVNIDTGAHELTARDEDPFLWADDIYAGMSTELGHLGGAQREEGSWPYVPCDPEYDFYTPLIVNANSTYFQGKDAAGNDCNTWKCQCLEAIREGVQNAKRNDTKESQIDLILLNRKLYIDFLNRLDSRERAIVTKSAGLRSYGFGDVVELDGIETSTEYAVPSGTGYALSIGNMEMKCMEGQLMTGEGPYYNEELQAHRYAVSVLANIKMKSPRNFVKFVATS